jgi:nucleoside-specific outer membrane channel protein Tsx
VPQGQDNRGEYDRGDLREWYVIGPLGLGQGITLAAQPPCRAQGSGALAVELAVRGSLSAALVGEEARIELRDSTGREAFTYGDLFARDARGQLLPTTMAVKGKLVMLRVDDTGAAYPLEIHALLSTRQGKLVASDSADYDRFGASVAVSAGTALIGASRNDEHGTDAGAAYVLVRGDTGFSQQAKLAASDGAANDNFGVSVAVAKDTALVGSMFHDGPRSDVGAAYVFVRSGTLWTQEAKLLAADGASDDQLGISAALSGNTALVGTINHSARGHHAGAVYVFVRDGTRWTQEAKLTAADGEAEDQFGISVAISGDTAVVGAYGDDDLGSGSGSAYVFVRSGTTWTQQAKLTAPDSAAGDQFGISVAVSRDTAVVGANLDDDHGPDSGSAYVFVRSGTTWTHQAKLTAPDGTAGDQFGVSVAVAGDQVLVGMPNDNDRGAGSGSAYVFVRSGATWTQTAKLWAIDGTSADLFGTAVALSETTALVGALGDDDLGSSSGSAYAYAPPLPRGAMSRKAPTGRAPTEIASPSR